MLFFRPNIFYNVIVKSKIKFEPWAVISFLVVATAVFALHHNYCCIYLFILGIFLDLLLIGDWPIYRYTDIYFQYG